MALATLMPSIHGGMGRNGQAWSLERQSLLISFPNNLQDQCVA
jgi:hypothetical protein